MSTRQLRLQAASQRRELLLALQRQLSSWLQDWSVQPGLLRVQGAARLAEIPSTHRWLLASTANGRLWIAEPDSFSANLGAWLAATTASSVLGLSERVGARARNALLSSVLASPEPSFSVVPDTVQESGDFGYYCFEVETPDESIYLVMDWSLADRIALPPQQARQAVHKRESGLGDAVVRLNVLLDLGGATLAETSGLRVGDVLVSSTPLDSAFQLSHPDSRPIATGRLFTKDSLRAIQLEGNTAMRTSQ